MFSIEYSTFMKKVMTNIIFAHTMEEASPKLLKNLEHLSAPDTIKNVLNSLDEQRFDFWINQAADLQKNLGSSKIELMICEIFLCRNVDAFEYYLTQILTRLFKTHREILNSNEKPVSVEEILLCSDIDELISRIVEKKVTDLGFKGLQDIVDYLNRNLKINFDTKSEKFHQACEIFLARNLVVHNATLVNEVYLQKVKKLPSIYNKNLDIGQLYPLNMQYVTLGLEKFDFVAQEIDLRLTSKYNLL